jgi:hypothetical protein
VKVENILGKYFMEISDNDIFFAKYFMEFFVKKFFAKYFLKFFL